MQRTSGTKQVIKYSPDKNEMYKKNLKKEAISWEIIKIENKIKMSIQYIRTASLNKNEDSPTITDEIQVNCEYTRITSWKVVKQFYKYWRNTSKLWIYTNYKLKSCEAVLQILMKYK